MAHTPGPWLVSPPNGMYGWEVVTGSGIKQKLICQMSHHPGQQKEAEANARLIAAAPELLAALHKIASCQQWFDGDVVSIARAAIAKAEQVTP